MTERLLSWRGCRILNDPLTPVWQMDGSHGEGRTRPGTDARPGRGRRGAAAAGGTARPGGGGPRGGGRELAGFLSVSGPGAPVVAMPGFAGSAHPDRRLPLLVKPFTLPVLLDAVRSARQRGAASAAPRVEHRSRARRLRHLAGESTEVDLVSAVQLLRTL